MADDDTSLNSFSSSAFHTVLCDSTNLQYRTCNTRFTNFQDNILSTSTSKPDDDGGSIKRVPDIITDFADPEAAVFWGTVTDAEERKFLLKPTSTVGESESLNEVSQDQTQQKTVCKKDSGIDGMDQTLSAPTPTPKPRPKIRPSLNRFGFDMKNKRGYSRQSLRRSSVQANHYLRAPKTPKWNLQPMCSSTPFTK